ncbi:MAG TPA: ABC transporter permease [Dehalococcoidia bacterium]|nr:ABC transporter permease [Dehalococcoidia bacterium]
MATLRIAAGWAERPPMSRLVPAATTAGRYTLVFVAGVLIFALILLADGHNAYDALKTMYDNSIASEFGRQEILVKMIPFGLCAAATAIPARAGLINVGGEGQFYMGALFASGVILFSGLPSALLLPAAFAGGAVGGGAWAGVTALLRIKGNVNEAISSLLLNFVAIQIVNYFVYGPWRDPEGPAWPYSAVFPDAATLPVIYGSRVTAAIFLVFGVLAAMFIVFRFTRVGFRVRVVGGNAEAAERSGISVGKYLFWSLAIGGAVAGLAGMAEVTGIQGRLRSGISVQYGYIGFLASWLGGHSPLGILLAVALFGAISVGGDSLQIGAGLPASSVNILMSLILFGVLASRRNVWKVGG